MSDVVHRPDTFFALYDSGRATAEQIDDFVEAWHEFGDDEPRSLAEYLGVTDGEYGVPMITDRALPAILAARRANRPLRDFVAPLFEQLQTANDPEDAPLLHAMRHWLCSILRADPARQNFSAQGRNSTSQVHAPRCCFATYQQVSAMVRRSAREAPRFRSLAAARLVPRPGDDLIARPPVERTRLDRWRDGRAPQRFVNPPLPS